MSLISQVIGAVSDGIEYDRTHITIKGRRNSDFNENNFTNVYTFDDQPNMEKARSFLNDALGNLNRNSADKGVIGNKRCVSFAEQLKKWIAASNTTGLIKFGTVLISRFDLPVFKPGNTLRNLNRNFMI